MDAHIRGEPVALQAGVELGPGDAEERGGLGLVALGAGQGGPDGAPLQSGQGLGGRGLAGAGLAREPRRPLQPEVGRGEQAPLGQDQGALDRVR
jgi:hypothetical protein